MDIDWDKIDLGKRKDKEIALELGVSQRTVCLQRNKRQILPFSGIYLLQEGQTCRSMYKAMYDAYLHDNNIDHQHEIKIDSFVADFKVGNEYHEIAGMLTFDKYRKRHEKKKKTYNKLGIDVIWFTAEEVEKLYKTCKTKIKSNPNRICADCGKKEPNLVKKVCRKCYMKLWHSGNADAKCIQCNKGFYSEGIRKFCSHECYSASLRQMNYDKLFDEVKNSGKSIRQVALDNGVKPSTLYQAIRRSNSA